MIKLIVSDMDGTLLNERMEIPKATVSLIKRAQERGIHFAIATGRDYPLAAPLLKEHTLLCPLIASNGGQYFDGAGRNLYNIGLEKKTVRNLLSICSKYEDLHEELMTSNGIYSNNVDQREELVASMLSNTNPDISFDEALDIAKDKIKEMDITFVDDYSEVIDDNSIVILKVAVHSIKGKDVLDPLKTELNESIHNLAITASSVKNLEINHLGAQKGLAVARLARDLGLKRDQVMTIGDNINDLSMLEWAKYSVAMENGEDEVKAVANYRTASNRQNGVGDAISRVLTGKIYEQ
ncbi:MAG: HAD family phosphatase [Alkalibacterium sp.]|nr:HAD family phosphatase [Alkalibacterium sp.]